MLNQRKKRISSAIFIVDVAKTPKVESMKNRPNVNQSRYSKKQLTKFLSNYIVHLYTHFISSADITTRPTYLQSPVWSRSRARSFTPEIIVCRISSEIKLSSVWEPGQVEWTSPSISPRPQPGYAILFLCLFVCLCVCLSMCVNAFVVA